MYTYPSCPSDGGDGISSTSTGKGDRVTFGNGEMAWITTDAGWNLEINRKSKTLLIIFIVKIVNGIDRGLVWFGLGQYE